MKRFLTASLLAAGLTFGFSGTADAAVLAGELGILDTSGINPETGSAWAANDTYRLVMVTSTTTNAVSSDIATYNSVAQAAGDSLGGTWLAIVSTPTVNAIDNTATTGTGVGIFLVDGTTKVADSYTDFWDASHDAKIDQNNLGATNLNLRVYTGTKTNGLTNNTQSLGGSATGSKARTTGITTATNGTWTFSQNNGITDVRSIYAISEVLTVVPEPSSLALLGLGGLAMLRRRRP